MSRYSTRQPFTTTADLVVKRGFLHNGTWHAPGDVIKAGTLRDRLAAALYEQRKLDMAPAGEAAPAAANAADKPKRKIARKPKAAKAAKGAAGKPQEPQVAPAATDTPEPASEPVAEPVAELKEGGHTVLKAGMGGFKVIAPNGEAIGQGWATEAEARAEAARLDADAASVE